MPCSHLADENLMGRLHMLSYGSDNSHGSVEALRCHKDSEALGQKSCQIVLNAGLTVASGNAYDSKVLVASKNSYRIVNIMLIDALFNWHIDEIGNCRDKRNQRHINKRRSVNISTN